MNLRFLRFAAAASLAALLTACTSSGTSGGSTSGNWSSIGTISDGNIKVSIDKNSIRKNGALATFRDKKVVSKADEEKFTNTPAYKTAIGEWEIHCTNKTYRLTSLKLFDKHDKVVSAQKYTAAALRPMSVMNGTITEKQYEEVCSKKL
ncbi:surface-adhesin E family protein [Neisseria chenwenguii]|uniref:Uncharacterized protein n=1 Tax=Neisseria chenwenguii TaxID=1853278 RepID=A0A220S2C5_9NEIS|nr:surface-adhesin E family protein [Neisseria chenwenguii]ASK27335.1 hypothetical protein BG910_05915 [Neisseria chenwenguii]ROV56989.1 hypothetical protein EGS38_02245 [Neisseria chenwenguii]